MPGSRRIIVVAGFIILSICGRSVFAQTDAKTDDRFVSYTVDPKTQDIKLYWKNDMSKKEINFYDFANYFKGLGCKNALYLDGYISRTYLPEQNWIQTDGNFGVIIGVTVDKK